MSCPGGSGVGEEPPATWRATGGQSSVHWLGDGLGRGSAGEACIEMMQRILTRTLRFGCAITKGG